MNNKNNKWFVGLLFCLIFSSNALFAKAPKIPEKPALLLANIYDNDIEVSEYWVSEKYDGVRAYWNGKHLISRNGNRYNAPKWFTKNFPSEPLDGELWIGHNAFEGLLSTVKKKKPVDNEWKKVTYQVFELPNAEGTFTERLAALELLLKDVDNRYIKLIKQVRFKNHYDLMKELRKVTGDGGEGLMMHYADALYSTGRSDDLLKVKQYKDDEATVIKHLNGRGQFEGMLGALLVENREGKLFKVGTGFSNEERKHPPMVGATISYKYYGKTRYGIPRFASFIRVRDYP